MPAKCSLLLWTACFLERPSSLSWCINLITPYPGSVIYDNAETSDTFNRYKSEYRGLYFNKPDYSKDDSYYKGLNRQSKSDIRTAEISNNKYIELRDFLDKEGRENNK